MQLYSRHVCGVPVRNIKKAYVLSQNIYKDLLRCPYKTDISMYIFEENIGV